MPVASHAAAGVPVEVVEEVLLCARYGELKELQSLSGWREILKIPCAYTGNTALMLAAANNHKDIVVVILEGLESKAELEMENASGNTALHWAALNGNLEVAEMLLNAGATANSRNSFNKRPFDEALTRGFGPVCELLARYTDFSQDPEFQEGPCEGTDEGE